MSVPDPNTNGNTAIGGLRLNGHDPTVNGHKSGWQKEQIKDQRERLAKLHRECLRWFGTHYDLDAINATMAAAAVEKLDGDPLWILLVSGSSTAKTETVMRLENCERVVLVSTLTTEAALLSATGRDDQGSDATGGIMRELGDSGILVLKDVTSILSMNPSTRAPILAALREIYDGSWYRGKGTDGGGRLKWEGRATVVGAVTTVWDTHYGVIAAMGDRFVLLRIDSTDNESRLASGNQSASPTPATNRNADNTFRFGRKRSRQRKPVCCTSVETV